MKRIIKSRPYIVKYLHPIKLGTLILGNFLCMNAVYAQEITDSLLYTFGVSGTAGFYSNQSLSTPSSGNVGFFSTGLMLDITKETPIELIQLSATGSGLLNHSFSNNISGKKTEIDIGETQLSLRYNRNLESSSVSFTGAIRSDDIAFLNPLEDFIDPETGEIVIPSDQDALFGQGTRLGSDIGASLTFGNIGRLSTTLQARLSRIDYSDTTSPGLVNSQRWNAGGQLDFGINSITQGILGLNYDRFEAQDAQRPRNRVTLNIGANREFNTGNGGILLNLENNSTTLRRAQLTITRGFSSATDSVDFSLGGTTSNQEGSGIVGQLSFSRTLASQSFGLQVNQQIVVASDDSNRLITLASLNYSYNLSDTSAVSASAIIIRNKRQTTNEYLLEGSLLVNYSKSLAQNWSFNASSSFLGRKPKGQNFVSSTNFSISLSRQWSTR